MPDAEPTMPEAAPATPDASPTADPMTAEPGDRRPRTL